MKNLKLLLFISLFLSTTPPSLSWAQELKPGPVNSADPEMTPVPTAEEIIIASRKGPVPTESQPVNPSRTAADPYAHCNDGEIRTCPHNTVNTTLTRGEPLLPIGGQDKAPPHQRGTEK